MNIRLQKTSDMISPELRRLAVSARDMRPIFKTLGTNYHSTDEEAIFPKKSMFVLTSKSVMMQQDKSGHEKPVVVYSVREVTP